MAEQSLTSFIKEIMETDCIYCISCKDILRPPIMLVENMGNVCSICFEDKDEISKLKNLRNTSLENILKLLQLPCKYKLKGCNTYLPYESLIMHQINCKYQTRLCSLFKFAACNWEGNPSDFVQHFKTSHGDHVVNFENNLFILETSLKELNLVKLLVMNKRTYILRMQTNLNKKKLFYMICNITDEHSSFCEYSVKHKGNSDNYIKAKAKILSSYNIYNEFDENIAVQVDLDALKQISLITDTITNVFKIKMEDSRMEVIDENMLHFFECPVCRNYMKPPIYQCQSGHSICNLCKPKLERCPTCRAIFGTTRNYSLEGLTSGVQYPCMYLDLGCTQTSTAALIIRHECDCSFKPYNCPFRNCLISGNQQAMVTHLMNFHPDSVICSDGTGYTESFHLDQNCHTTVYDRKCVIAFDHIFRLTCKKSSEVCLWAAELFGSTNETKTFVYEVVIIDMRRPEKKLIRTDYCLNELTEDELFKKCVMFSNRILSAYSNHGMVTFHFNVKEK